MASKKTATMQMLQVLSPCLPFLMEETTPKLCRLVLHATQGM